MQGSGWVSSGLAALAEAAQTLAKLSPCTFHLLEQPAARLKSGKSGGSGESVKSNSQREKDKTSDSDTVFTWGGGVVTWKRVSSRDQAFPSALTHNQTTLSF